jgi:three-Cys-motif partner protein
VLRKYLETYVSILAARPVQEQLRLTLVDGFAGGGAYVHPDSGARLPGSPLIMAEAMAAAEAAAKKARRKDFLLNVEYVFIEKEQPTIEFLTRELRESKAAFEQMDRIEILRGTFSEYLDRVLLRVEQRGRSRRVIFLLDQYGFSDVRMADLRRIFKRLPNAEVILTIAIDWLIDHWTDKANYDKILADLGVNLSPTFAREVKEAFPNDWRPVIQNTLYREFRSNSGAGYYTPFFIHSADAHRAYWLLHYSGHSKARDVMMQLHWKLENHFQHFGQPGLGMLGFDPRRRVDDPPQLLLQYQFDASAKALTRETLLGQIPPRIDRQGIRFADFFKTVVNETPATKEMLALNIRDLALEKELEIWTSGGKRRQNGVQISDDDVIRRPQQRVFLRR